LGEELSTGRKNIGLLRNVTKGLVFGSGQGPVAGRLAFQEGLCSMELVSWKKSFVTIKRATSTEYLMDVSNWKCVAVLKVIEKSQLTKNLIGTS
jgi:hypothetical protein